jgi:hypothetical protein
MQRTAYQCFDEERLLWLVPAIPYSWKMSFATIAKWCASELG